jgi:hypothetical protein
MAGCRKVHTSPPLLFCSGFGWSHSTCDGVRGTDALLGKEIVLHPMADGVSRYLTAEVTGNYEGLLRLVTGQNKSGGGQGIQPSLVPLLRFEIQGVALAA